MAHLLQNIEYLLNHMSSIDSKEFMDHLHEFGDNDNHPTCYCLEIGEEEFKSLLNVFDH